MKKYNLLPILLIGLLIFSSCSSTDENELSVVGGWTVSESKLNGEDVTNQSVIRLLSAENKTEFRYLVYNGVDIELKIELGNWSKNGNTLTIDFDDANYETKIYTITEITSSSMKWESEISGEGTLKEILTR
ncbi:lipocalin family protein [Mariniflexile sp. AS56]|uniref:lipocalin family protein n=1 Tax=Mariniflexile sp. AS56 TaxID=3063957 RepID=UPI0026EB70F1|nr:lipocalin family protein [Mariniflexile sp. AS56]MDO7171478.1 lipocalin family protein [Mariniflexile sp. AS56]